MTYTYKAMAMMLLWLVCSVSVSAGSNIDGFWEKDESRCNDIDNQHRVTPGKQIDSGMQFSEGKESVGLYDGMSLIRCRAVNEQEKDKKVAGSNKKTKIKYTTYTNDAAEFVIDVPLEVLYPQGESGDHMGQIFKSVDMDAVLSTYGVGNIDDKGIDDLYFDALNPDDKNERVFTYKLLGDNWFAVSGYHNNDIFYKKTILSEKTGLVLSFYFKYPKSKKSFYSDIVARMSKSFKEL